MIRNSTKQMISIVCIISFIRLCHLYITRFMGSCLCMLCWKGYLPNEPSQRNIGSIHLLFIFDHPIDMNWMVKNIKSLWTIAKLMQYAWRLLWNEEVRPQCLTLVTINCHGRTLLEFHRTRKFRDCNVFVIGITVT